MYTTESSTLTAVVLTNAPVPTNDVTVTFNLTGSFVLKPVVVNSGPFPPFLCTQDISVPGTAIVTCHSDFVVAGNRLDLPFTATAEGTISSSISLTAGGVFQGSDTRPIVVLKADSADLSVRGSAPGSVFVGFETSAFFGISNAGPLTATGVQVTFNLTGPATISAVTPFWGGSPATCTFTGTSATCAASSIARFGSVPISIAFTPTSAGDVFITASVTANEKDPILGNNTFTTVTNAVQPLYADLSVALQTGNLHVIGKPLAYTLTVRNNGPDTAGAVSLYDVLPYGTTFVSGTPTQGTCYGGEWGSLQCDIGALAAGATARVALVVTPTVLAAVTNDVTVYDNQYGDIDPDYSNNEAFSTVTVHGSTNQLVTGPPTKGGCGLWPGAPIDALEDGNPTLTLGSKPVAGWFVTSDGTGFQSPPSPDGLVVAGGPGPSKFMVHSTGSDFWNWGAAFGLGFGCSYDVSRFHAVRFDVKAGGTGQFFVEVPTIELQDVQFGGRCTENCSDFYRAYISLPDDAWYRCTVAFTDLFQAGWGMQAPFDVGAVMGTQFNIETWQAPYDLSIDNVELVAPPKTKTSCIPIAR